MKSMKSRVGIGIAVLALVGAASSLAFAETRDARPQCSGEATQSAGDHRAHAEARFKKADKNGDGFLTQDEVGDKRWSQIQVADANKDGRVSFAEMQQAFAEGKLGHRREKPPA